MALFFGVDYAVNDRRYAYLKMSCFWGFVFVHILVLIFLTDYQFLCNILKSLSPNLSPYSIYSL